MRDLARAREPHHVEHARPEHVLVEGKRLVRRRDDQMRSKGGAAIGPAVGGSGGSTVGELGAGGAVGGEAGAPLPDAVIIDVTLGADGASSAPDISNDGRFVVFHSDAGNLAAEASEGGVLVTDLAANRTWSVGERDGVDQNPLIPERVRISGDGQFVFFRSNRALTTSRTCIGRAEMAASFDWPASPTPPKVSTASASST